MKKIILLNLSIAACLFLTACPTPNAADESDIKTTESKADESTTTPSGNFSKQAYITLMTCLKTQQPNAAVAIDQAISVANQLPDSAFDNADSPIFAVWAKQAETAGCK